MKNIIRNIFAITVSALCFNSCKKDYLETAPTSSINSTLVFQTTTNAFAALNGIHRLLYTSGASQDQGGEGSAMINLDMLGDDLVMTTSGNGWYNNTYKWVDHRTANSVTDAYMYLFYYQIISNANLIINNVDAAEGETADKNSIKGQALVYRAWSYFNLVQMFGKRYDAASKPNNQSGVPLLTSNLIASLPRAKVEEVYAQILKDLADATTNLTGYNRDEDKSQIDVSVAKGLKARVALTMQDWTTAAQYAVEARQVYSLMSPDDYISGFNDTSIPEWMWGSHQISDQQEYFSSFFAYMSANFGSTNIRTNPKAINSTLYNMIPASDIRKQLWDPTGANSDFPIPPSGVRRPYMNRKFLAANSSLSVGDVPYMRMSEMFLIEAEAKARSGGQDAAARDALFVLQKARDENAVKSVNSGAALINEILVQRRMEFWGEGFRFFDLKRLNLPLDRTNSNHTQALANVLTIPGGDPRWEFLFPQAEINANPAIVQNP
ncbi:MAG: RagB/SusD family nutrient uptake outer membrane protein [Chitinophagaceae bacterium]